MSCNYQGECNGKEQQSPVYISVVQLSKAWKHK